MDEAEARKALAAVSKRRQAAEYKVETLKVQTHELILAAFKAGVPKTQLAEVSGLTRQTVYTVLLRAGLIT